MQRAVLSGPKTVTAGERKTYRYVMTAASSSRRSSGLDVAASGGTLSLDPSESKTRLSSGEVTHSSPKSVDGPVTWSFRWRAPSSAGTYTLYAAGIRGDGHGDSGDETGSTTLEITVLAGTAADAGASTPPVGGDASGAPSCSGSGCNKGRPRSDAGVPGAAPSGAGSPSGGYSGDAGLTNWDDRPSKHPMIGQFTCAVDSEHSRAPSSLLGLLLLLVALRRRRRPGR